MQNVTSKCSMSYSHEVDKRCNVERRLVYGGLTEEWKSVFGRVTKSPV